MENKKLNDLLISNRMQFEEQLRDMRNKARDDFELSFRQQDLFSTKLFFQFDQFVLEFNSSLPFVIQIHLQLLPCLSEFVSFVLQHEFDLSKSAMLLGVVCIKV